MTREEMTRCLVLAIGPDACFERAMQEWWFSLRQNGGFRLTTTGMQVLADQLELEFWEFPIKAEDLDSRTLIALDRHLAAPYYVHYDGRRRPDKIVFFGSSDATTAYLYDNLKIFAQGVPGRS